MTNRGLASGVFRAWGLMWWIYVLLGLPQFANALLRNPYGADQAAMRQYAISAQALSLGCQVVIGTFLVRKAGWLAEIVFPVEQEAAFSFGAADFQAILFSAVGLYFLLDGGRHLLGGAAQLMMRPRGNDQNAFGYLWQRNPEQLAMGLGATIAGGLVLFGRGRSLNPWTAVRRLYEKLLGLKESPDE